MGGSISDHTHGTPGGAAYLTWDNAGAETAAPRYLSKSSTGETKVLWGNAGVNRTTGGMGGGVGCNVSGTLNGSMAGSIVTNSGITNSTGGSEVHNNVQPFLVATRIIKH